MAPWAVARTLMKKMYVWYYDIIMVFCAGYWCEYDVSRSLFSLVDKFLVSSVDEL